MGLDTTRVLRIGVVWRGQVVAERVLQKRTDISVGSRPDTTITVNPQVYGGFPAMIPLAVLHGGAYHVVVPQDPAHTVQLRGGPAGAQGAVRETAVTVKGQRLMPIENFTGGSLTMGEIILMFQFVRGDSVPTITREETVLRIGLVHEDRLLSDQVFHGHHPVVIGADRRHTISLPDIDYKGPPATFTPQSGGATFRVRVPKTSNLRLAIDGAPMDAAEAIQKKIAVEVNGFYELTLPVKSRGRASLGPYTLLFQVLRQSITVPTIPRKSLIAQFAGPLVADSVWTVSLLIAIVLVGSIVGQAMLFQSTTGKFLGKERTEEENSSTTYEVLVEEKEEPKKEDEKPVVDIMSESAKKAEEKEIKEDKKKAPPEKPQSVGKTVDPEEVKRNAREAIKKNTIAGAFGGASTKLFGEAGEGEEGTVVAKTFGGDGAGKDGADNGPGGGLKLAGGGGGGGTMEKVGNGKAKGFGDRESEATKVKSDKEEKKVNISLSAGEMGGTGEAKTDVAKVISRKNSAVQRCYEAALRDNPDEGGKVKVSFTVGTAGTVTDVSVSGASGGFSDCIKNKFMGIRGLPLLPAPQSFNQSYVFTKG